MTTLKQKFFNVMISYATIEKKNELYYQAVKEWLQQKRVPIKIDALFLDVEIRQRFLDELLEDLRNG